MPEVGWRCKTGCQWAVGSMDDRRRRETRNANYKDLGEPLRPLRLGGYVLRFAFRVSRRRPSCPAHGYCDTLPVLIAMGGATGLQADVLQTLQAWALTVLLYPGVAFVVLVVLVGEWAVGTVRPLF